MKYIITLLFFVLLFSKSGALKSQNMQDHIETIENGIWFTTHLIGEYDSVDELTINYHIVEALSINEKKIVAYYSAFLYPSLLEESKDRELAQALGNFSTLEEARQALIKNWTAEIPKCMPYTLKIKLSANTITVKHYYAYDNKNVIDEFKINSKGNIKFIGRN